MNIETRLRNCAPLMEAMGLGFDETLFLADEGMEPIVNLENDMLPGSALFVAKGMALLEKQGEGPWLQSPDKGGPGWGVFINSYPMEIQPTMVQAVALALLVCYEGQK